MTINPPSEHTMTNRMISIRIVIAEIIGLVFIIALIWANEFLDIPHHLFGATSTPVNLPECLIETICIVALGIPAVFNTWRYLLKIKHLEGFLPVCSYCKKIRIGETWIPFEEYISDHSDAVFSHGMCPNCQKEHFLKYLEDEDS